MSTNEKQFGIRLKEPALSIIEKRAEKINKTTPEVKITAGGVARYAVEEYAKQLDRKVIETQLQFQYIGLHTFHDQTNEDILEKHPYVTKDDFQIDYSFDELEKLTHAFEEISNVLESKELIPKEKVDNWISVANELRWNLDYLAQGIEQAEQDFDFDCDIDVILNVK